MALIRLDVNAEMDEVNRFLEKADAATVNLANHAVAKASKNTRSGARQIEGSLLDVGKGNRNTFNYKGKGGRKHPHLVPFENKTEPCGKLTDWSWRFASREVVSAEATKFPLLTFAEVVNLKYSS